MITWTAGTLKADDHRDHRDDDHRYYEDRYHHDRHEWNQAEARAWRHWLTEEQHRRYYDWSRARERDRREYWRWRHEHQDWR
jgi:hypothetical protein